MRAYVTLLSNDRYLKGVMGLKRALEKTNARYPLICALSVGVPDSCEDFLTQNGIECVRFGSTALENTLSSEGHFAYWDHTFDKLKIWELDRYETLVYLDSDMLILKNLDHLFERRNFTSVCAGKSVPGHEHYTGPNSGLMVIKPDTTIAGDLCRLANEITSARTGRSDFIGDQDILQAYLPDWDRDTELHLDEAYNIFADCLKYYVGALGYSLSPDSQRPLYVIHFIGRTKPWMKRRFKSRLWLIRMCLRDRYYMKAYRMYKKLL